MTDPEALHDLVGAYVLGALEPAEFNEFVIHLSECAECRNEVAVLQPVVDFLAAGLDGQFPDRLRNDIVTADRTERGSGSTGLPPHLRDSILREVPATTGGRPNRTLALATKFAVAASVLVALGLLFWFSLDPTDQVDRAIEAPDAETVVLVGEGGELDAYLSHDLALVAFADNALAALPDDERYAAWLLADNGPVYLGDLERSDDGSVRQAFSLEGLSGSGVAVSIETGSGPLTAPSDQIILVGEF